MTEQDFSDAYERLSQEKGNATVVAVWSIAEF